MRRLGQQLLAILEQRLLQVQPGSLVLVVLERLELLVLLERLEPVLLMGLLESDFDFVR